MAQSLARAPAKDFAAAPEAKAARGQPRAAEPDLLSAAGNQAMQRAARGGWRLSRPDDPLEREAERGAEALLRGGRASISNAADQRLLQRECDTCAQRPGPCDACAVREAKLDAAALRGLGGGRPLPEGTRGFFEGGMQRDLSAVRIHDDPVAATLAQQAGARAFTHGNDIVFGAGRYAPGSESGNRLLAHELIHTAQQRDAGTLYRDPLTSSEADAESDGGAPVCEAESAATTQSESTTPQWSFDPYAEDIIGYSNGDLIDAILYTEDWLAENAATETDHEAYLIRQGLLEEERLERVAMGHLWLESVKERQSSQIYQLITAPNGAVDVVQVTNLELLYGPLQDCSDRPLMTEAQFRSSREGQGLRTLSLAEYQQEITSAREPEDSGLSRGASGGAANSSLRDRLLAEAFANHSRSGRSGAIAEAFALTDPQALYGFGIQDRNLMSWTHPERGAMSGNYPLSDLHNLYGLYPTEGSVKMRLGGTDMATSPSAIRNFSTYLEGYAQMLGAAEGHRGFSHFMDNAGSGRTAADVRADFGLIVPADDAAALRQLLGDPSAHDLTESGARSETPNYQRAELSRIYDALLRDAPIQVGDNGAPLRSIAELDAALQSGRIGVMQHDMYLRQLGGSASSRVYANTDFTMETFHAFDRAWDAVDPSLRPQPAGQRPTLHTSTRDRAGANADSASANLRFENYINRLGAVIPENTGALHVDPDDAAALQALLRNPLGRDTTPTGRTSRDVNFQRSGLNTVYNALLQRSPVFGPGGREYRSVEAIHSDFTSGVLDAREYSRLMHRMGRLAAAQVQARTPAVVQAHADAVRSYERSQADYRAALDATRAEIAARTAPEFMAAQQLGGGWRGDLRMARGYGGRGFLFGAGLGMAGEAWRMGTDGRDNPDAAQRLFYAGGREGLRGAASTGLEALAISRVSQYSLARGAQLSASRALAMRIGARFVPGGLVDAALEGGSMLTDGRENSTSEVGYRLGRAFVIGGTSALAGAVVGAKVGTALGTVAPGIGNVIGFVVGAAVGALVGFIASSLIPSYEELVQEQVPLKEFEDNVQALGPTRLQDMVLADQEYQLLQAYLNGPETRGPHDMTQIYDERNQTTSPGLRNWQEMLLMDRIHGGCMSCHVLKEASAIDSQFPDWHPARQAPLDRMSFSALREFGNPTPRPTFMGQQLPGTQVSGEMLAPALRRGSGTAEEMATYINMIDPNIEAWNTVTGGNARGVLPRGAMNSPMTEEEMLRYVQGGIDSRQRYFEFFHGEVGEHERELYRSWMEAPQGGQ